MTTVALHELLNTLYVMTQGAYLHMDHETILVEVDREVKLRVPVHHLAGVVVFGNVLVSPHTIHRCAEEGRFLVFMEERGRFKARVVGPTTGNILLRQAQHRAADEPERALGIARNVLAGKLQNSRQVLLRGAREAGDIEPAQPLRDAAAQLATVLQELPRCATLDNLRGKEGEAAAVYFSVLGHLVLQDRDAFKFDGRNRRPPRDRFNALISFLYAVLTTDCVAACEAVGLDPQLGFLHAVRPGRPSLALDMVEELRAFVADRLALTLVNRKQVAKEHFIERPGGAVVLDEAGRKVVLAAYQRRKAEEVQHPVLDKAVPIGLIPHVQARLLARHLRGDLEFYLPFTAR